MIPGTNGFFENEIEVVEQPTLTHALDLETGRIRGYIDEREAMKQAVHKILNTERYQYVMYSWNYGIELSGLYGEPVSYVCPELKRRITEALTWDGRIESVSDFEFDISRKGIVHVEFTVHTVFGDVRADKEVNI